MNMNVVSRSNRHRDKIDPPHTLTTRPIGRASGAPPAAPEVEMAAFERTSLWHTFSFSRR